ncbi:hypothetical protein V1460_25580 [Streptomyces sp. SCSIO 30461]|uniref:hypothetical protein n=1 Tax=Streptomyces sp. SCSIO 30461 TaxID=3118085 RepID=UPI0030CD5C0E
MTQTYAYTLLGRWDSVGDLRVEHVGVNWPEDKIRREADALNNYSGWSATFEAETVTEAFRAAGQQHCDETQIDCASRLLDDRGVKPQVMYEGRTLQEQSMS